MMANLEADYAIACDKPTSLIDFLAAKMNRTVDSIKGSRKRLDYRKLVEEFISTRNVKTTPTYQ